MIDAQRVILMAQLGQDRVKEDVREPRKRFLLAFSADYQLISVHLYSVDNMAMN